MNTKHQLDEMVDAIQQVTNISEKKGTIIAKQQVANIISQGIEEEKPFGGILSDLVDWAKK